MKKFLAAFLSLLLIATMIPIGVVNVSAATTEYAIFPGSVLKVTQGAYGEYKAYSHNGQFGVYQNAFDFGGNTNYCAPFSGTITKIKTSYNAVVLQSDEKVYWANGVYDYMSVTLVHDNDISDLYVGKHINQGEVFYQPGVKDPGGKTTGTHLHMCVNQGKTDAGISIFSGDTRPNEAFFLTSTTAVQQTGSYSWKTVPTTPTPPVDWATIATGTYLIKNKGKGIYANVEYGTDQNGQNIRAGEYGDWASMKYEITPSTTTEGYVMRPLCSWTRVVNVYGDTVSSGNNVCLWDDTGHNSQRWGFEKVDGGYVIRNVQNPSCVLTVQSDNDIKVQTYTGADSQIWILEPLNCSHTYDNDCDATCNECGEARDVADHVYDNDCDADCNECGVIREVADHTYDDDYDADCNECGAIREVPERPGDANGDGAVNARDLVILQQYMAGWDVTFVFAAADIDGNGHVVARDLALLQQYIAGWNVTLG